MQARLTASDDRKMRRLAKNRVTAKLSRQKKRDFVRDLSMKVEQLQLENSYMQQKIVQRDAQIALFKEGASEFPACIFCFICTAVCCYSASVWLRVLNFRCRCRSCSPNYKCKLCNSASRLCTSCSHVEN
ncbi:TPA: hypothetical protein ACH3X1_016530 [Trebouxia sp. C0004]